MPLPRQINIGLLILVCGAIVGCSTFDLTDKADRLADTPLAKARVANGRAGIFDYMCLGAAGVRNENAER